MGARTITRRLRREQESSACSGRVSTIHISPSNAQGLVVRGHKFDAIVTVSEHMFHASGTIFYLKESLKPLYPAHNTPLTSYSQILRGRSRLEMPANRCRTVEKTSTSTPRTSPSLGMWDLRSKRQIRGGGQEDPHSSPGEAVLV